MGIAAWQLNFKSLVVRVPLIPYYRSFEF